MTTTLDQIRDTLKDIHKEMIYQTKLLENIFQDSDGRRHNAKETAMKMKKAIEDQFLSHPSVKENPDILKRMESVLSMMPGGNENDH